MFFYFLVNFSKTIRLVNSIQSFFIQLYYSINLRRFNIKKLLSVLIILKKTFTTLN